MAKKVKFPHLLGSKWTALQKTWGWRHFQVVNRKNEGEFVFAELVASCDSTTRFWLNARALKDRRLWRSGWKSLQEQAELAPDWDEVLFAPESITTDPSLCDRLTPDLDFDPQQNLNGA